MEKITHKGTFSANSSLGENGKGRGGKEKETGEE